MSEDRDVWTVNYRHRHGLDEIDCVTEADAERQVCQIIVDNWSEIDSPKARQEIRERMKAKDWVGAHAAWQDYQDNRMVEGERIEIEKRGRVLDVVPDPIAPEEEEDE